MDKIIATKRQTEIDTVNLLDVVKRYLKLWPLFLLLICLSILCSWIYLKYTPPTYRVTAKILLKDEKKGVDDSKAMESFNLITTKKIVENEIEVIKSRVIIGEVVRNLILYAPVTEERKFKSVSAYNSSPIKIELYNIESLKETKKIYFTFNDQTKEIKVNGQNYPIGRWATTSFGTLRFIKNPNFIASGTSQTFYFSLISPKKILSELYNSIIVSSASKTATIIDLTLDDEIPQRGEDILNELLAVYEKESIHDKNVLAENTITFIEKRLKIVKNELDSIEIKLQSFKTKQYVTNLDEQGKLFLNNVSGNDHELSNVNVQLAVLQQVEDYIRQKNGKGNIVPATLGVDDRMLSQMLTNLNETELTYERLKKTVAQNSPNLISLQDQISKLKPNILENVISQKNGLTARKEKLTENNTFFTSQINSLPKKERALVILNREQSFKNDIYAFLVKRREEASLTFASTVSDSRVIDNAETAENPISPKKSLAYLGFFVSSILLGAISVTIVDCLNNKIISKTQIENLTQYPVIAEVYYDKTGIPIVIGSGRKTFMAEQFRKIRVSLPYLGFNSESKKILITSTISGEGKSFISTNLALSIALTDRKVILLEFDLTNPGSSKKLNVNNEFGISDYLSGTKRAEEIIKNVNINENLFIISAGTTSPNPSDLILNGKTKELFNYLENKFDYIIVDSAPAGIVTDAYELSPICDVTLYIVRQKYTLKRFLKNFDKTNTINELKNVGIVFNGLLPTGFIRKKYETDYGDTYIYNERMITKKS